ncbi:DNA repair protein rad52 [Cryptotrichosporon argae]
MTLSTYLLDQLATMDQKPNMGPPDWPLQTPHVNAHVPLTAQTPFRPSVNGVGTPQPMSAPDGSQWGAQHGMPPWMMGFMSMMASVSGQGGGGHRPGGFTPWSEAKVATLQARLQRKLGPEYVTQRPGPGGGPKLSYVEGWKVVNLANEVFGFNGWSTSITSLNVNYMDVTGDRCSVGITAIIRVTLQDGCYHEDLGFGSGDNFKGKGMALEKAQKEAVTDGLKRALKTFGNVLGNCLYDREYTKEVSKVKVGPAKFNVEELERRPEFTPQGAGPSRTSAPVNQSRPPPSPPPLLQPQPQAAAPAQQPALPPTPPLRALDAFDSASSYDDFGDGDSFLDQLDESILATRVHGDVSMLTTNHLAAQRSAAPPPVNKAPYQHRQRPEQVRAASPTKPAVASGDIEMNGGPQSVSRPELQRVNSGATSSGGSSERADGAAKAKKVGGFTFPGGNTAASARAAAISSALSASAAPIRAESPRIPSGNVDALADAANARLRAEGMEQVADENGGFGGFASARGLKRSSGEDRSASRSPSKPGYGQPRPALGELSVPEVNGDWKRTRY